jgi:hypothetical protein
MQAQKLTIPAFDSLQAVKSLVKSTCDKFGESIKKGEISEAFFGQICLTHILTGDNFLKIRQLSGDFTDDEDTPKPEHIDRGFRSVLHACVDQCAAVDTFFNYDGHQRPAYAHFSKAVCNCIGDKRTAFKDPALAQLKYTFIRDSCFRQVFSDQDNIQIAHTANSFQTKAEVDAFDRNFMGYFIKNCPEGVDFFVNNLKVFTEGVEETKATPPPIDPFMLNRSNAIQHVVNVLTPMLGSNTNKKMADYFATPRAYQLASPIINTTKIKFKGYSVLDYIPNITKRSDGVLEHRYTVYTRLSKTKKRHIVCQIIFEFEEKSELIALFRYVGRAEIANLEALQQIIDNN